jgi:prevent-host-death family protein
MKVYTYSEARQRLADVLNNARSEEVITREEAAKRFL